MAPLPLARAVYAMHNKMIVCCRDCWPEASRKRNDNGAIGKMISESDCDCVSLYFLEENGDSLKTSITGFWSLPVVALTTELLLWS